MILDNIYQYLTALNNIPTFLASQSSLTFPSPFFLRERVLDSDLGGGISISSLNILIGPSSPSPLHADITIEYYDFQLSDISIFRGTHFVFLDTILSVYISYWCQNQISCCYWLPSANSSLRYWILGGSKILDMGEGQFLVAKQLHKHCCLWVSGVVL